MIKYWKFAVMHSTIKSTGGYLNLFPEVSFYSNFPYYELQYNPVLYTVKRLARCSRQIF